MAQKNVRQQQSSKISRSKAKKQRMRTIRRSLIALSACAFVAILITASIWVQNNRIIDKTHQMLAASSMNASRDAGLRVRHIYIDGREKTPQAAVLSALGVNLGGSLLELSPADAKARLESISTIREASIERVLPDTVRVVLEERKPVAIWQNKKVLHVIDKDGIILKGEDAKNYPKLMLFVGEGAPTKTAELLAMLAAHPQLHKQVTAAVRIADRRWNLRMSNGVTLMLPEDDANKALDKFAKIEQDQEVLEKPILSVDMRLPERIFIKLTPENVARRKPKAQGSRTET